MPVDALIYVTTDEPMEDARIAEINAELVDMFDGGDFLGLGDSDFARQRCRLTRADAGGYAEQVSGLSSPRADLLEMTLAVPYYGLGYERGHWPTFAALLEFLRRRVPKARVWYGRDDGAEVARVTDSSMDAMWSHWAANGSRPYFNRR